MKGDDFSLLAHTRVLGMCSPVNMDTKESAKGNGTNRNRVETMLGHLDPPKASEHKLVPLEGAVTDRRMETKDSHSH